MHIGALPTCDVRSEDLCANLVPPYLSELLPLWKLWTGCECWRSPGGGATSPRPVVATDVLSCGVWVP